MWCVVHVRDKNEKRMEDFVAGLFPENLNAHCFHLTRIRKKKYRGIWQTLWEELFPGYVFISTDQPDKVYRELKKAPRSRLLLSGEDYVLTLESEESGLIGMIEDKDRVIGLSTVKIGDDGSVRYQSGPLVNVKNRVRKLNFHKRAAEVETSLLGLRQPLYLGIEIEGLKG